MWGPLYWSRSLVVRWLLLPGKLGISTMGISLLYQPSHVSCHFLSSTHTLPLSNLETKQLHLPFFHVRLPVPARGFPRMGSRYVASAAAVESPAKALRRLLESPGIHQGPVCHDALSAKLIERAGFPLAFMGGFAVSAARLGLPDVGLISYGEVLDQGYQITQAVSIPVVGDGDNGYGNHMNIKRTVKGFIRAGFAGILLEDQLSPKACGHTRGRKVASREEAVMRIRAAIDARNESGSDLVIIARTDSRQAVSLEEALWRSRAFGDAGADVLFVDALASREEMKAFCKISPLIPKLANMLEGGGKTPVLSPAELQEIGYKLVGYPLSLIGVSIRAMEDALVALKGGRIPPPGSLPTFEEIKETVGFNEYYKEEERYKITGVLPSDGGAFTITPKIQEEASQRAERVSEPVVEVISPLHDGYKSNDSNERSSGIWSRTLRLKVTGNNGFEKLDVRIPAGFLEGMSTIIPGLGGVNLMELLENASQESTTEKGKLLLEFNGTMGDKIQTLPLSNLETKQLRLSFFPAKLPAPARRFPRMGSRYVASAAAGETPAKALRRLLESPGIHQGPVCHDALSAKLIERAGFPLAFMGGFAVSAARLGLPDVGLISYGEVLDQGYQITQAVSIPVVGDGDNGYGNHMNIKRTVKGFIRAGFAGILLEDQLSPKACGHTRGRKVASREEAVMRIRAAIDARNESGSDFVIIARTDSRQAISLEEALWRSRAFGDAGADILFIDALASREEMKAFCQISPSIPKLANMLEGGGKTPILSPAELQEIGYKLVVYPLSLIGVSIRAMEDALTALKGGRIPPPGSLPTFEEIKETVGFNEYYKEEERYKLTGVLPSDEGAFTITPKIQEEASQRAERISEPVVELISPLHDGYKSNDSNERSSGIWSRTLRLKVTGNNGFEKLDIRIPAGLLEGMSSIIPGLGGVNLMELLENASQESTTEKGKLLLEFNGTMGDKIQVFVE
ncbi:hypothetical protein IEQ34_001759 [Dendrobium chrysotoxum]|uniref:Isocitrate lyase n=1 Tax=Dendrobium chrysotoxum TaxID=161865 RepID=A0AAV7HMI2_DENCH|nr:hypothetical protein IEQ34_001759 [Dendrobium chrysotoxum]